MAGLWKKVGAGALIGLAFGIVGALGFIGVTSAVKFFTRDKGAVTSEVNEDADAKDADEEQKEEPKKDKVENASLTKAVDDGSLTRGGGEIGMSVTELAQNNLPCVVSITNTTVTMLRDMWGSGVSQYENVSRGSGIIIGQTDEELLIATNSHVVNGADTITVGFVDDEIYDATVKGEDTEVDLAVIGVKMKDLKDDTISAIKVAVIGDSAKLQIGEQVVAIGNAIGYGQSVTTGIVSALDRDIPDDNEETRFIQTDAAINPGNSGGALLNMKGEVIGINSSKMYGTAVEGIGYAIPMDVANPIIENLMNRKSRDKVDNDKAGYLGISGVSVDAQTSKMYGIPEGIFLQEVTEGGPAEDAGILKGDVIKKFDGVSVSTIAELREKLEYYEAGEKIEIVLCRQEDGEYTDKTVTVTLGSRKGTPLENKSDEEGDKKDDGKGNDNEKPADGNKDQSPEDIYNSLPDEIRDFFFGFGH